MFCINLDKSVKNLFLIIAFILIAIKSTEGQENAQCKLTKQQLPAIRGLQLGMANTEIIKVFPGLDVHKTDEYGYSSFTATFFPLPDRLESCCGTAPNSFDTAKFPLFKGLEQVEFELLDNKIGSLKFFYDSSVDWNSRAEFTKKISESLKLPNNWMSTDSEDRPPAFIECDGLRLEAQLIGSRRPSLLLVDTTAIETFEKRKLTSIENKRKSFKP